ncbi:MAG: hypothetical protein GEV05_15450 [Betaproteobacteria bacterium]|nr:hypothetical protein [Betaproteobacteria bacterium]
MTQSLLILDPVAPPRHARARAQAITSLAGKRVGFIDNSKPNFHHLVDDLAELLVQRHGAAAVIKRRKRAASIPAPADIMREMGQCDLIISGSGD